jgi:hypothetical protein
MTKQKMDYVVKTDPSPQVQPENKEGDYYTSYMATMETLLQRQTAFAIPHYKKDDVIKMLINLARNYSPSLDDPDINLHTKVSVGSLLFDICILLSMDAQEICSIIGTKMYEVLTQSSVKLMAPASVKESKNLLG